jgi:hypothetical protein
MKNPDVVGVGKQEGELADNAQKRRFHFSVSRKAKPPVRQLVRNQTI